jgi:6-phosphofructokinase 2
MNNVITLTMNPVLDKDTSVAGVIPNKKLRCTSPDYYAGGGGVNISRALKKLGGSSLCMYVAGGPTGTHLQQLLSNEGIDQKVIPIEGWTRDNLSVRDTITNLQYRFGVPGPHVTEKEWQEVLAEVEGSVEENDYLVASGKLPLGMPPDFYVQVSKIVARKKGRFILDTSGEALLPSLEADIFLMKPNLSELSIMCGVESISVLDLESLSQKLLKTHSIEILVVSLGAKGAFLASRDTMEHIAAPTVHQKSTIGAGDSMVAGMVLSLIKGKSYGEMVRYGIACGTAATLHPGTQLCKKEDADKLYQWLLAERKK